MLSHLEHIFGFQLIEGHVIEVVKRFRMNSRTMVRVRGFEARKGELQLRTCVYSRYASMKTLASKRFYRSQATSGLAVDHRQNNQEHSFFARKGDAARSIAQQTKTTTFVDLED